MEEAMDTTERIECLIPFRRSPREPEGAEMDVDPSHIMQIGSGFWPSKVLLSAVELELFSVLHDRSLTGEEIEDRLGLHPRAVWDFLDSLVGHPTCEQRCICREGPALPVEQSRRSAVRGIPRREEHPVIRGLDLCGTCAQANQRKEEQRSRDSWIDELWRRPVLRSPGSSCARGTAVRERPR